MKHALAAAAISAWAGIASAKDPIIPAKPLAFTGSATMARQGVVHNQPPVPYPRPGQPGYSVAKAFVAIVRHDQEVDVQDLSYAFGLPALRNQGFVWSGPFGGDSAPQFGAYYDPAASPLGITKIVIAWDANFLAGTVSKKLEFIRSLSEFIRSLFIYLRPDACPSEAEMVAATGVSMKQFALQSTDAGPSYLAKFFIIPNGVGEYRNISYAPSLCELLAYYKL